MNEKEKEFDGLQLEDILKEFADEDQLLAPEDEAVAHEIPDLEDLLAEIPEEMPETAENMPESRDFEDEEADETGEVPEAINEDTVEEALPITADTIRLDDISQIEAVPFHEELSREEPVSAEPAQEPETVPEAEPEEEPAEPVIPPPIVFRPRSRLRELKRKLIAGPEKRYYELSEIGVGKVQIAMFLCVIVIALSAGAAGLYAADLIPEDRMRLMVFGQILAMLFGALLGSQQIVEGITDLFRGKFTLNTMLVITFLACCTDAVFCLKELRVPICAAFTLEVFMTLWNTYHRRTTEMGMMDTMRKAVRLDSVVLCEDYHEGRPGFLRGEGQVEDFMDNYAKTSGPERVQNIYALICLLLSAGIAVVAGLLHDLSMAVQIFATALLVGVPASIFISFSRPMAVLERRLHSLGTVFCGWQGVRGLCRKGVFPLKDTDIFPAGACKMNGVKFYGDRDPEQTISYAAALMRANGGGLAPIFDQLLASRNGIRYEAVNLQHYGNGGIGGEICDEPVLMGTLDFLKDMGVEIPEGTMVKQAVYVSIDGELSGLFAITYSRMKYSSIGMATLCGSQGLKSVVLAEDFMLTAPFLKEKFGIRTRKMVFPARAERAALAAKAPEEGSPALALTTLEGLAPAAYAVTGARMLRLSANIGLITHIIGGLLGLLIMLALAFLGSAHLLTPVRVLLYQLIWMIPGLLVTMWTRTV